MWPPDREAMHLEELLYLYLNHGQRHRSWGNLSVHNEKAQAAGVPCTLRLKTNFLTGLQQQGADTSR